MTKSAGEEKPSSRLPSGGLNGLELERQLLPENNMYRGRKQIFDWAFTLLLGDFFAIALSFPATLFLSNWFIPEFSPELNRITVLNCIFYGVLILFFIRRFSLYTWEAFLNPPPVIETLPLVLVTSGVTFITIRFAVSDKPQYQHLPILAMHALVCYVFVVCGRGLVHLIDTKVIEGISTERIAFMGWSLRLEKVLGSLRQRLGPHQEVVGYITDDAYPDYKPPAAKNYRDLGNIENMRQALKEHELTVVIADANRVSANGLRAAADHCADAMANLRLIPRTFDLWVSRLRFRVLGGVPVMGVNDLAFDRFGNRFIKRAMDIAGSLFGLAISLPVMGVLALLIRRESPGPVLFFQTRLGQNGRPFRIIKMRSMRLDAEKETGAVWAVGDDPRRLKIGAFMRSWNLDELPQFWNVLKGEMSLVGPRPERPEFVQDFRRSVRYYNLRHSFKPGLTGWAAVHGFRGDTSLEDRLDYDLYYLENWSPMLDIRIMLMTLAPPKNAY